MRISPESFVAGNGNMHLFNPSWSLAMKKTLRLRKTLSAAVLTGGSILAASATAQPSQGGYGMGPGMMDGYGFGWMGGYGGIWVPILLVIVVAGLVAWIVRQNRK